nr:putative late blight resistance protein homolog R1A-3 isoform X2 [Coffea arabica]
MLVPVGQVSLVIDEKQVFASFKELELIRDYVLETIRGHRDVTLIISNAFPTRIASLLVHVANQACSCWFSCKTDRIQSAKIKLTELVKGLQNEIDPTNPKFMELHLNFLRDLYSIHGGTFRVDSFCDYLHTWRANIFLEQELSSLLVDFFNTKLEEEEEEEPGTNVKGFFAEIIAVLVEAFSLWELLRKQDETEPPPCSQLLIKICLLKAELFLKGILLNSNSNSTFSYMLFDNSYIQKLKDILENLRMYSNDIPTEKIEYGKKSLELIEELAKEVAFLCQSFEGKKITESTVKNSLFELLLKIVLSKAESVLMELLSSKSGNTSFLAHGKEQIGLLLEQLNFITLVLPNQQMKDRDDVEMIFVQAEAFARGVTHFCRSFASKKITNDMINQMILSSSQLLQKVKHIKPKLKEIANQIPLSNFPETYRWGFIDFLVRNIQDLLKHDPDSIAPVKTHIEEIQLHLESLSSFLLKISELDIQQSKVKDLGNHIAELAYKLEYVIDSIEIDAHWQHFFWFYDLLEELRLVAKQASLIHVFTEGAKVQNSTDISQNMVSRGTRPEIDEILVDLRDEEEVIVNRLIRGSTKRDVVSIVGMPGMGKTTLARKVYNNPNVTHYFHCRAWCTVSQVYDKREILLEILRDVHGLSAENHHMSEEDLESKLRQCLLRNKYLIVMDDVWDIGAWSDLTHSLPDDCNKSRILVTSRRRDLALEIEPNSDPHSIRPFTVAESWILLEQKVFQGDGCPEELLLVGKEIAQKCKGLPLSVVAISGLLRRTEKRKDWWKKIAESLSSEIFKDPEARCMEILELSYRHLPGNLKACFLYLGVFLEDKDIPVHKLIQFWLAEGFIQVTESKSLEDIAENYLMDLINRSLVIISKRRYNGKVKACRLHDLIRDFCQSKAKEEKFLQLVTRSDEPYASFPISDYGFEFYYDHNIDPVMYDAYRLSIFLQRNHFVESRPFGLGTRSLVFFAFTDSEPRCPYDISFICHNFKFLRVLDFECINMGISFPDEIGLLVRLRYLAVCGYLRSVPESIANLRNLETLIVKGLHGKIVLPYTIWHLASLRHLHVNDHVAFNLDGKDPEGCFQLENLVSFSRPSLSCGGDMQRIIRRFPNLCKLRCIFYESRDSSHNCNQFPRLDVLTHLESLNIFYYGRTLSSSGFILPMNLKKLTISEFHLPWSNISAIGRLKNLQVLKLNSGAFEGQTWEMKEGEFQELKFLKLDSLNIVHWKAASDPLPKLQRLVLQNCKDLQEVPDDFAEIPELETIEVLWCGQSAEESAKEIEEANEDIKVLISRL